jgi:hypothetical protein
VNQNISQEFAVSISTQEISGNFSELVPTRNIIAEITVDSNIPTSLDKRASIFKSDVFWAMIGVVSFAGMQIL